MTEMGFERDFGGATDRATDAGTDAGTLAESDAPPCLILPYGSELGVDGLLALLEGGPEEPPPIETAAGAETGAGEAGEAGETGETVFSGGGSAYGDDLGGPSVAGLAALGTLDVPTESGVPNFPLAEDREEPAPASAAVTAADGQAGAEAGFNLTVDATVVDINDPGLLGSANIIGAAGNDVGGGTLRGSNDVGNIIYGLGDDDGMRGKGGDDTLTGGDSDVLRFVKLLDGGGDGPELGDLSAAVSSVQDDGSDVTLVFEDGGTLWLGGLATGAIDSVNALLSEIGQSSIEVV